MTTWIDQDGNYHDDEGDGPAVIDNDEYRVGWQDPFTDWNSHLFEGMGQYGVYTVSDPWEPATFPDVPYPSDSDPPYVWPAGEPIPPPPEPPQPPASTQQPESPLSTPASPGTPTTPHFGPPPHGGRRPAPGGGGGPPSHARPSTMARGPAPARAAARPHAAPARASNASAPPRGAHAPSHPHPHSRMHMAARGTFAGFDVPFTDDDGNLLMDPHPSHRDWPYPMTYGDPVMTGWETPLTDLEGQLLAGPGQYGQFTMTDPYDHRDFNNVLLESEKLIGDPFYYYTGDDEDEAYMTGADADTGQQFGQALGSMFGSATGDNSSSWGEAGKSVASSIEQGSDSGDWGSAIGSIAASVAKVAVPAIVKAATSSSSSSSAPTIPGGSPTTTTTTTAPATSAPAQRTAMSKLNTQLVALAKRYRIPVVLNRAAPKQTTAQQLQSYMQSIAPQG